MNAKIFIFFILLSSFCIANKEDLWVANNEQQYADSTQPVEILNAKRLDFKKIDEQTEIQILIGDVRLRQELLFSPATVASLIKNKTFLKLLDGCTSMIATPQMFTLIICVT